MDNDNEKTTADLPFNVFDDKCQENQLQSNSYKRMSARYRISPFFIYINEIECEV